MDNNSSHLLRKCPTCKSHGFKESRMRDRCEFCDGTVGGCPPTDEEVKAWNDALTGYEGRTRPSQR